MSFTEMMTLGGDQFVMEEGLLGSFVLGLLHLKMPISHCLLEELGSLEFRGMVQSCAFRLDELTKRRVWAGKRRGPGRGLQHVTGIGVKS